MDLAAVVAARQPVTLAFDDLVVAVPRRTLGDWLAAAVDEEPFLSLLDERDAGDLYDRLLDPDDPLDDDLLEQALQHVLEVATGWPHWVARAWLTQAAGLWDDYAGLLTVKGVDLWSLPLDEALRAVRHVTIENMPEKERATLLAKIARPPATERSRAAEVPGFRPEDEGAAWLAAAGGKGGTRLS